MSPHFHKLKALIETARELGIEEAWFNNALRRLSIRWSETLYNKLLHHCLTAENMGPLLDRTFPIPRTTDDLQAVDGPYKLGYIKNTDIELGLHPTQLQMHGIIGGGSGYGKSTLIKILCQQILAQGNIKVWMIDPKEGGDYRFLAQQYEEMLILRPDVMRINPLGPILNVTREALREAFTDVTADSFGVYDASEGLLSKHTQKVFERYDSPCLLDVISSLKTENPRMGGRMRGYLDSLETRFSKILTSLGGIIDCRRDYFSELFEQNVVFEVGELSGAAQRFLVPWVIMKLVLHKIKNPTREISHLLIFDEAQSQIWSKNLEKRDRQSYMATLATQCRAFGLGIIVLAQNPALKLMTEIIANSCVKICLHLGGGREIYEMAQHMGLTFEQRDTLFHLQRGEAICRTGLGYMEPVSLEIHHFEDQPVSHEQLTTLMKPRWDALLSQVQPVTGTPHISPPGKHTFHNAVQTAPKPTDLDRSVKPTDAQPAAEHRRSKHHRAPSKTVKNESTAADLSPDEGAYLRIVKTHPWRLITEVYRLLNDEKVMGTQKMSQSKAVKIRKKLIKTKYLKSFTVRGTGKSGRPQCDVPTEIAGGSPYKPRGGLDHGWWCYRVAQWFRRKDGTVKIGDTLAGNECDLDVTSNEKRIGVEVVITTLIVENIVKNLSTDYHHETRILCIDAKTGGKMEKQIQQVPENLKPRIKVEALKGYFVSL